jgi:hypothetical protein
LFGHEHIAEHRFGHLKNFIGRFAKPDAAFEAALESSFAASAGMHLRFDDDEFRALGEKFPGNRPGGFRAIANVAGRDGHAALGEKLPGLVFVNVHRRIFGKNFK